ncbi:1-deoxy-D-xylulose-5-phosphate reductoisomerase [Candidatus Darwinibacter acetoxidans]|jgi:1-deoxy-D-xylulose-5-phosphate reductoisomerase|nr:1-deoxy-D-xylulose-5-phosphate reductoisomerase [Bacillota bacterium]
MPNVVILGSTGSIGTQTLDVIRTLPEFKVLGLAAGTNFRLLRQQIAEFKPQFASILSPEHASALREEFSIPVYSEEDGLEEMVTDPRCDLVVAAMVGAAGLKPTLAALQAGKRVALANKETLVAGGHLVMRYRDQLVPIDSEHSALWQLFGGRKREDIAGIVLTASGGPFYSYKGDLGEVTIDQALAHPRWNMGGKISIDSATLMNKGLEVIEAHWLFDFPYDAIDVVVHPQSIIHSLIRLQDGALLAHLGTTDMRLPIQYALTYPQVQKSPVKALDLAALDGLTFGTVDHERFPSLRLAYTAGREGGAKPIALNAANEEAVWAFLEGRIKFSQIPEVVSEVIQAFQGKSFPTLEEILAIDAEARLQAQACMGRRG